MSWTCVDGDRWELALDRGRVLEMLVVGDLSTWWVRRGAERREVQARTAQRLQARPIGAAEAPR